jgi:heme/copper-type cytochrome/quinol oxidase subunit 3
MSAPPTIDVSTLPPGTEDHRSPIWWGNLLLTVIETVMFALMIAVYFYLRGNFSQWPPVQSNGPIGIQNPVPDLLVPTLNLAVLLASCVPMALADRAALRLRQSRTFWMLLVTTAMGGVAIFLRFQEFGALHFRWDDNAYGSVTWTILGLHLLHLIVASAENLTMLAWILVYGLDQKHGRDVRVAAFYWYWIAAIWIVLYAIVFPGPRFF